MEVFVQDLIDRVNERLGVIQAESASLTDLRYQLKKLVNRGEEPAAKPNGKPKGQTLLVPERPAGHL